MNPHQWHLDVLALKNQKLHDLRKTKRKISPVCLIEQVFKQKISTSKCCSIPPELIFNVPMAAKLPRLLKTWHLHQEVGQVAVGYGETTWKNQGENYIAFYCYCQISQR